MDIHGHTSNRHYYWRTNDMVGRRLRCIEDVFVREPWRKRGIAKFTLAQALKYLKSHKLQ
ncbi:GNAT family N-acetyltransferase [Lysinibacillus fusiformis]|uniref:GNAT family N-acetyltransferase n=1 Tax=Lysinibacillus fusiformis TaxID=28031 RepID=UPI003CF2C7F1